MNLQMFLLVIVLIFSSSAAVCPWLSSSWSCPVQSRGLGAHAASSTAQAAHPRRLSRLSTRLYSLVGWRTSTCGCRVPGARSKAAGEHPSASPPKGSPVRTGSACTLATLTLEYTRLFGDGKPGQAERIQAFRGPACRTTFSARRDTPLYRLKTPSHKVAMVLSALAEGLDPSAAERVFGYRQSTITTWLSRAGSHAQILHERSFRHLWLPHLQLDELRTRLRSSQQILWLWLAIDPLTKILPVLELGPRTQHMAHRVIHSLRLILATGCLPLFTSDGLNLYFYAITAHFGQWLQVGCRGRKVLRWQVAAK